VENEGGTAKMLEMKGVLCLCMMNCHFDYCPCLDHVISLFSVGPSECCTGLCQVFLKASLGAHHLLFGNEIFTCKLNSVEYQLPVLALIERLSSTRKWAIAPVKVPIMSKKILL